MRVHLTELVEGDRLSSDVFNSYGLNVISKNTTLNQYEISKLHQHQVDYVDILPRGQNSVVEQPMTEAAYRQRFEKLEPVYLDAVNGCEQMFTKALQEGKIDEKDVRTSFQPLVDSFRKERNVVSMLLMLTSKDDYTYQHSVQVGMLSYYIATWLEYNEEEALQIGKAGFLHDIGKCRIEDNILNKPGRLTDEEFEHIKNHTVYGHEIVQASFDEEILAYAALQHHERMDGTGYPNRITGDQIHPIAKIVAVADVYSAMTSSRIYKEKRDLLFVLKELYRMSFAELDPHTTHTFILHMLPNFIGKQVELKSGRKGTIVMTNPIEYFRPLIQFNDEFIDLAIEQDDDILEIYM